MIGRGQIWAKYTQKYFALISFVIGAETKPAFRDCSRRNFFEGDSNPMVHFKRWPLPFPQLLAQLPFLPLATFFPLFLTLNPHLPWSFPPTGGNIFGCPTFQFTEYLCQTPKLDPRDCSSSSGHALAFTDHFPPFSCSFQCCCFIIPFLETVNHSFGRSDEPVCRYCYLVWLLNVP